MFSTSAHQAPFSQHLVSVSTKDKDASILPLPNHHQHSYNSLPQFSQPSVWTLDSNPYVYPTRHPFQMQRKCHATKRSFRPELSCLEICNCVTPDPHSQAPASAHWRGTMSPPAMKLPPILTWVWALCLQTQSICPYRNSQMWGSHDTVNASPVHQCLKNTQSQCLSSQTNSPLSTRNSTIICILCFASAEKQHTHTCETGWGPLKQRQW